MDQYLSIDTINNIDAYAAAFQTEDPFRHVVIDDFFSTEYCQSLLEYFPAFDEKTALTENKDVGRKSVQEKIVTLGKPYADLDAFIQGKEFLNTLSKVTGIPDLEFDPHYFGGGTHHSLEGQDLDPHVDFNRHPISKLYRRLNVIIYLNKTWSDDWGGALDLHKNPRLPPEQDEIKTVSPLFNRCVIFETTRYSWHGFRRIQFPEDKQSWSRKSIALYFYTKTRPKSEMCLPHSTIYVERHLPTEFMVGKTLTEGDLQHLQTVLTRRDQHLQRLYRYISELLQQQENMIVAQAVEAHDDQIEMKDKTMLMQADVLAEEQAKNAALVQELEVIYASNSWKMTAPLRTLRRYTQQLFTL